MIIPYIKVFSIEDLLERYERYTLDTGVWTFMTGYTDKDVVFKISNNLKKT